MKWYSRYLSVYEEPFDKDAYKDIIKEIRQNLAEIQSKTPIATVSIIAYNEERHLLACLWSLSRTVTRYPIEIIGINNDSTDKTEEIYKELGLPYFTETRHSIGFARQCGLTNARGKYHINVDADTLYPSTYVDTIIDYLERHPDVIGVNANSGYFLPDKTTSFGVYLYTKIRDVYLWTQSFKRPELSVRGFMFSYRTKEAQKIGIRTNILRGEEGALAFELRKLGRIVFLRSRKVHVMTIWGNGAGSRNESVFKGFCRRVLQALKSAGQIFHRADELVDTEDNLIDKTKK